MYQNTLRTYQHFFLHWRGLCPLLLFLKHGCIGLILVYSIFQTTILFLVNNAGCCYCPFSKKIANVRVLMVFLCLPSKKQLIYLLLLYLIFAIYHFSVVSFLINSKLQRFFQFLKVMTLLCFQTIGLFLFSPVFLRSSRNFSTSGYQDFSQSLISLIIISMALDHITLLLWLS